MEITTKSPSETEELGKKIGASLKGGEILALIGELGSGKTSLVKGIAKGMGIKSNIISPTFMLMRVYKGDHLNLYHIDLYRLDTDVDEEVKNLGIYDELGDKKNIFVIEWADRFTALPQSAIKINITTGEAENRTFNIQNLQL